MSELVFSYKLFNPLFWHIREAMRCADIRYVWNRGGSSSGKSVSTVQAVLLAVLCGEGSALVLRKIGASLKNTVYEEFKVQARRLCIHGYFRFTENNIACVNGLKVDFSGLDDPEKIKSITGYRWIVLEEATEFDYVDFTQITFRLRGKAGLQVIAMFNPVSEDHWIKTRILDANGWTSLPVHLDGCVKNPVDGRVLGKEYSTIRGKRRNLPRQLYNERTGEYETYAPDTVELVSTYLDNFWVVGSPDGVYGYYDRQTIANYQWYKENDYNFYRIYALGEWGSVKTGGEFLRAFDSDRHIGRVPYVRGLPVHVSIDNNVLPYISVSFFQIDGKQVRQFGEVCASDPDNTVSRASAMAVSYLRDLGHDEVLYLYGDASTRSQNTIDDEKRSFLDKFMEGLEAYYHVEERIPKGNPSVPMSGEFINHVLSGSGDISFVVDDNCRNSIVDYNNVKKDVNGGILKARVKDKATGQSYEKYGHLTDCLRYVFVQAFNEEYTKFSLRRKRSTQQEGGLVFFNPENRPQGKHVTFVMPDNRGMLVILLLEVHVCCDLVEVVYKDAFDKDAVSANCERWGGEIVFDSKRAFFYVAKELRERGFEVRILSENASNHKVCIEANASGVGSFFRFNGRYAEMPDYGRFMASLLDYAGGEGDEAMYSACSALSYIRRKYGLRGV